MSEEDEPKQRKKKGTKQKKKKKGDEDCECPPPPEGAVCKDIQPALFPQLQPFPAEGIVGMYPIQSACKREVAKHMLEFQKRLQEEYFPPPNHNAKLIDFKNKNPLNQAIDRVMDEIEMFEAEIDELKHMVRVDAIKKKYGKHDPNCPCSDQNQ